MEFKELVQKRYAARAYENRKIDDEKIDEILEMIRLAPSALNLQPWKVKVVADDKLKEKMCENSMDQKHISTCSHVLVFCANTDLHGLAETIINGMKAAGAPEETIKFYEMAANNLTSRIPPEARLCEAQKNVFIAAAQGVYAAKSLGIDSCIVQGFDPAAYSEILDLPSNIVPTVLVLLGYGADEPTPKVRFPKEEIFF
ncbi:nitroreductase family protein [Methanobacterium sp.]|uniref:nitroreductase family protein n=1 Tax=Methanobacterium sp. TaxID=2164 RepID=UPI003C7130DE